MVSYQDTRVKRPAMDARIQLHGLRTAKHEQAAIFRQKNERTFECFQNFMSTKCGEIRGIIKSSDVE